METKKFIHFTGAIFLLCASVALLWQMFGPTWFKNIRMEVTNRPYAREISVSGEGKVTAKPDIATITLSVVSEGSTVKDVTADGNTKMNAVNETIKKLGIDPKDMVTSAYYLSPQYPEPPVIYRDEENVTRTVTTPTISGYRLEQQLTVKIRNLDLVDDVLDTSVKAGTNQVGQLLFNIDDDSEILKEARAEAFQKARTKAEEMAAAAGVRLGRIVTFYENAGGYPMPYYGDAIMTKSEVAAAPAPTIEPGSREMVVNVSVTYEIE